MGWYGAYESYSSESIKAEFCREGMYADGARVAEGEAVWTSPGTLWGVLRDADGTGRAIVLWLVQRHAARGDSGSGEWLYKPLDESCGPTEVNCPLRFLDAVPGPWAPGGVGPAEPGKFGEWAYSWRQNVREYWADRSARARRVAAVRRALQPGAMVELRAGLCAAGIALAGTRAKITSVSPRRGGRGGINAYVEGLGNVRIRPSHIETVITEGVQS